VIGDQVPGAGQRAVLVPLVWAFGLSFTSFGLGLAAAPWVVWFCARQARFGLWAGLVVFLIGWNSALALHSLFQPVGTLACLLVLGGSLRWGRRFRWPDNYFRGTWMFAASKKESGSLPNN